MTGNQTSGHSNRFHRRSPADLPPGRDAVTSSAAEKHRSVALPKVPRHRRQQVPGPPPADYDDYDPWESDDDLGFIQEPMQAPSVSPNPRDTSGSPLGLSDASFQTAPAVATLTQQLHTQAQIHPPAQIHSPAQTSGASAGPHAGTTALQDLDQYQLDQHAVETSRPSPISAKLHQLSRNWAFWSLLFLGGVSAVAIVSAMSLFRIPGLPNCRAIFWPTASAATRIQCAEAYAEEGSVDSLLAAIQLVNSLPTDHPLRSEINERIETWAERILKTADQTFQSGDIDQAIEIARRIPVDTAAGKLVDDQIEQWLDIWNTAEDIYQAVEDLLRQQKFREAFSTAIQLRSVGNTYWENTKYEEITQLITNARQDLAKLAKARSLVRKGTMDSTLEALELMLKIQPESYLYAEAQQLLKETANDMLDLAQSALDRRNANQALEILDKIPISANLQAEVVDFRTIIEAHRQAWQGTVSGLQSAIVRLQSIERDRPLYSRAQQLIRGWREDSQGIAQLTRARQIAEPGNVADLAAAILEANSIPRSSPAWEDAQAQISRWQARLETIEDQPVLDRAVALAAAGDLGALQAAITEAERIQRGRALYDDAQANIRRWRGQIQRSQDQPLLSQARQLASNGNYQQAIATAEQIGSNRALYQEAQADIASWRNQIEGYQRMQEAYGLAQSGTAAGLTQAMDIAANISSHSPARSDATASLNRWSWELLALAEAQAQADLNGAIALVQRISQRTEAYASAQLRLRDWQQSLEPSSPDAASDAASDPASDSGPASDPDAAPDPETSR